MNKSLKYNSLAMPHVGMSGCGVHWHHRDEYVADANEADEQARQVQQKINNFKTGTQQLELENLNENYKSLTQLLNQKTILLEQLKIKTKAWQDNPEANYADYLKYGIKIPQQALGSFWEDIGFDEIIGCSRAKDAEWEAQARRVKARKNLNKLNERYDFLVRSHRENAKNIRELITALQKEISATDKLIKIEQERQSLVMTSYEAKKRAEELALDQEANSRDDIKMQQAEKAKMKKKQEQQKLIIGLMIIGTIGYVALSGNKKKTVKVKL